jgi:tetratricopeptide (TPR) repeat protein
VLDLTSPTPLASLLSGLLTVAVLAIVYVAWHWLRGRRDQKAGARDGWVSAGLRATDRAIVHAGSRVVGTHYESPHARRLSVTLTFLGFAIAGAFLPWPWGLGAIAVGVLAIFAVFRHWARDEHEALLELRIEQKDIKTRGDLGVEVLIACSFLVVFAPVAFAQLQANGYGFVLPPKAGPFTFLIYSLIETLKAGSLVAYYDLFAGQLGYEEVSPVRDPSLFAKAVVLSYRFAVNLLILATLKRLIDIAQRRAEGLDLRHIEEKLRGADTNAHKDAVAQLKIFALSGRGNAPLLLERILSPLQSDDWAPFSADVRFAAAEALRDYGVQSGSTGAFYASIPALRHILKLDWTREANSAQWAAAQHILGKALQNFVERQSAGAPLERQDDKPGSFLLRREAVREIWRRREEAVAAYRAALEVYSREKTPTEWVATQYDLGKALGNSPEAVAAFRAALEVYTPKGTPTEWIATQRNLGNALHALAQRENNKTTRTPQLEEAAAAYRAALNVHTFKATPAEWATAQNDLGDVLLMLMDLTDHWGWPSDTSGDEITPSHLNEAIAAYRAALEIFTREVNSTRWVATQCKIGTLLLSLGVRETGTLRLNEAVAAYRAALEAHSGEKTSIEWIRAQSGLGKTLQNLGARESGTRCLEEAADAYRAALGAFGPEPSFQHARVAHEIPIVLAEIYEREPTSTRLQAVHDALAKEKDIQTAVAKQLAKIATQASQLGNGNEELAELATELGKIGDERT